MEPEAPLSTADVATLFGVDAKTVARWAAEGSLPSFRTPGGHVRFHRAEIAPLLVSSAGDAPRAVGNREYTAEPSANKEIK